MSDSLPHFSPKIPDFFACWHSEPPLPVGFPSLREMETRLSDIGIYFSVLGHISGDLKGKESTSKKNDFS